MEGAEASLSYGEATREHMSLVDFARRYLGSFLTSEQPGIGDETRQEATLLMSLLATAPEKLEKDDFVATTTTTTNKDSGRSASTDSSLSSSSGSSKRSQFSFTCPSLSLERCPYERPAPQLTTTTPSSSPAFLLGRPLKVDDADALRLNADAMALNVLQSFQKALEWRIQTWMQALSKSVWEKEKELLRKGADNEELKALLYTKEACLIVALQQVEKNLRVTGAGTHFRVLEEIAEESPSKRRRLDSGSSLQEDMGDYNYAVTHSLVMECVINLETPAGYAEITLHVPGTMEGSFLSGEPGTEEMKSVVINLDTNILSAMIEKGCRTIVRASVESWMEAAYHVAVKETDRAAGTQTSSVSDEEEPSPTLLTPAPRPFTTGSDIEYNTPAAVITPAAREFFSSSTRRVGPSLMMPIAEDFDESAASLAPRRISPQPGSLFATNSKPQAPKRSSKGVIISPPPSQVNYHEVPENSPSLPMLVEAACRVMHDQQDA